jgi:signal transduction histidine kinase
MLCDDSAVASTVAAAPRTQSAFRDPVLVLPFAVAAGLGVGWLGVDAGASGARIAVDLALVWSFASAAVVALERSHWHRARTLFVVAAFALLAADLVWTRSDALWTVGFVLTALWVALLVHVMLTFPTGRAWSRTAWIVVACGYGVGLGGQLLRAILAADRRDVVGVGASERLVDAVARGQGIAAMVVFSAAAVLVAQRLRVLPPSARRSQGPVLVAAVVAVAVAVAWVASALVSGERLSSLEDAARASALLLPLGVIVGVAWTRLRRSGASELVVELRTEGAASLRERLARTLGDPSLELAYRLDDGRYVDSSGETTALPAGPDRALTPLTARGAEVAVLVHDPALLDEPALVESVRATAGLVLENERLAAEVRAQLAEVRASRSRIVSATDAERRRIERDLHDGAQQRLVSLSIALGLAASRGDASDSAALSRAQDEIEAAIAELRELARGIHPTLLRDEGLEEAVEALARRTPLPVSVEAAVGGRMPDAVELAAYFVVSEALTNVVKHAQASVATVRLERRGTTLHVSVADDGTGGASLVPGSGLAGLRDRLEALDARLLVDSHPGRGTTIRTELPCGS